VTAVVVSDPVVAAAVVAVLVVFVMKKVTWLVIVQVNRPMMASAGNVNRFSIVPATCCDKSIS